MIAGSGDRHRPAWLADLLLLLVGAVLLGSAAFLYGRVAIYDDSGTYYVYGQHLVSELRAAWMQNRAAIIPLSQEDMDYFGARSPTYSLILFLAVSRGTLWGLLAFQALAASWILLVLAKSAAPNSHVGPFLGLVIVLTLGSSLSHFVSFAMPDVFAGLGALALLGWLARSDRLDRSARVGLLLMVGLAASFHPTIPPVLLAATLAGTLAALALGDTLRRSSIVGGAALLAVVAGAGTGPLCRAIERHAFGHRIEAPPFAMARLLEDGTGVRYLAEECARDPHHTFCQVPIRPPIDSDEFLWNRDESGTYLAVEPDRRAELREEQLAFLIGTMMSRPMDQLEISADNWWRQLWMNEVAEPFDDPRTKTSFRLFDLVDARPGEVRHYQWEAALQGLRDAVLLISAAGLLAYLLAAAAARPSCEERRKVIVAITVTVVVILVNAAITGIVSKPYARYQARVSWLVPAVLMLLSFSPLIAARFRDLAGRSRAVARSFLRN